MKWATPAVSSGSWFEPNPTETDNCVVFAVSRGNNSTVNPLGKVFLRQNIVDVISKIKQALLKKIGKQTATFTCDLKLRKAEGIILGEKWVNV
jgi:hypothetical protein